MHKLPFKSILATSLLVAGCATTTGWTPTVDTYNDPNAFRLNQDMQECEQLASQSSSTVKDTATGAAVAA